MTTPTTNGVSITDAALIEKARAYAQDYMSHYDASHDYEHIQRVLALATQLRESESHLQSADTTPLDPVVTTLGALLHDVGDKKYLTEGQDASTLVQSFLLNAGASSVLAARVQELASNVSYSSERKDPQKVREVLARIPELGVVQDADRLDAIGAVGIGRVFAFVGAKRKGDGLGSAIEHFKEKLLLLEGMMKTESGRRIARERTERLETFKTWWAEEVGAV